MYLDRTVRSMIIGIIGETAEPVFDCADIAIMHLRRP
jgi:hypothetical protein